MRFARSFEHEPQAFLDQVLELAATQRRLRFCAAVECVGNLNGSFYRIVSFAIKHYNHIYGEQQKCLQRGARPARSCLVPMHWIAANHRKRGRRFRTPVQVGK